MDDLDALLAELEQTSLSLNVSDSEPAKVCFLLERDNKEKPAATSAETNATQHKKLAPGPPKVLSGRSIQHREEDVDNIYSKVPTPQPLHSSPSSTSAAHQLDDLLASLGTLQSKLVLASNDSFSFSLQKILTAMDRTWHPEHFFCAHCGNVFGNASFHEKDGKPYCQKDFLALFSPKCRGCDRPVMDQYLSALNTVWHPECFVCGDCFCSFDNGSFFELNGRPYCELHFHHHQGTVCQGCGKPIVGRCVSAMGYKFHPEHFVCAFCLTQLHNGIFQEQNGKTYCNSCFNKLFA
ncbi:leupaxin [Sceloporus undulatus]|uniref:leupaxin n=1 Tax=Sceloporus undulatus TaxID=8520 RepID=UPI001C4BF1AF|nr:leupaxin [Sceloporus undulatus]